MAIGNRYELIDDQLLFAQAVLNVYFYKQISGLSGSADDLATAWQTALMDAIRAVQCPDITHVVIRARNVDDPTDFDITPLIPPLAGTVAGECNPAFMTWAFRMNRQQLNHRHGQKRISGIQTGSVNDGAPSAGMLAALNSLAALMDNDLTGASGAVYEPRIVRRVFNPATGITTYTDFPMGLVEFTRISTQNSRKVGRGS